MSQRQPWRPRQGLGEEARTQEASNKGLAISLALFGSEGEAVILLIGLYGWFVWALQYGYPNEVERPDGKTVVLCPLSYMRCCSWGALFAAFQRPAHRTTLDRKLSAAEAIETKRNSRG